MKAAWRLCRVGLCLAGVLVMTGSGVADWPEKNVTVYVGWSAGGSSDITSRALAKEMEDILGKRILVTNVKGAHGSIAARQVVRGKADGYRWFGGAAVQGGWPVMGYGEIDWTDFYAFLSVMMPTTIYVKDDAPWQTIGDLMDTVKSERKGRIKYGHPGVGSNGHIFGGLVLDQAAVSDKVSAIPYNGGREAGRFLLSGQIQFASVTMGDLADYAAAGRVRPLGNLYAEDLEVEGVGYPSVLKQYPDLEPFQAINPYYGIYVKRETPGEVIETIAKAFRQAIQRPSFQKIAVQERAGILLPKVGPAADEQLARIASARGWAMQDIGIAKNDPAGLGIPRLTAFQWPSAKARGIRPWPAGVE